MKNGFLFAASAAMISTKSYASTCISSLALWLLPVVSSLEFITPELAKPWHAHLDKFEIKRPEELCESQAAIARCPLLRVSHNGKITPREFMNYVASHDQYADLEAIENGEKVGHFFPRDQNQAHVALRNGLNHNGEPFDGQPLGEPFKHGLLWHMDNVGSLNALPPRISALHFLTTPEKGGETLFANLQNGIAKIPLSELKELKKLKSLYSLDMQATFESFYAPDGLHRLGPDQDEKKGLVKVPLFYENDEGMLTLAFTPVRFRRFEGMGVKESWEILRNLFFKYILTEDNIVTVSPEAGDTIVFRNDQLIHSSTPWQRYKGQGRMHWLAFVPTTQSPIAPEVVSEN